ncbi:MAG: MerR family transcriptional regulator, partial [Micromonosporaceae bacterium]
PMAWSIAEVARMSNVTSRTLRHYHAIGLLPPAWIGGNGYRYYEREQLLRLQQILVMRQLGLGLEMISEIVNDSRDPVAALRAHHRSLLTERDRFQRLADTVANTIKELEGGDDVAKVSVEHWFEGLDSETQAQYEAEAAERWGAEAVTESKRRVGSWSKQQQEQSQQEWAATLTELVKLIEADVPVDDPRIFEILDGHYRWLSGHWTPNRESYAGLGDLYADDPRFRKKFDKTHPKLAEFLRAAMSKYAQECLDP